MKIVGFQWDRGNWPKCSKHGVSKSEIEAVFEEGAAWAPDDSHSGEGDRFIAVGRSGTGRPLFVGFTLRHSDAGLLVRPITARYMHKKEARRYEAQSS